ncbi:hypothetical protein BYT27DRAFT_6863273 [Phlegmacium glaucopus]|nr:hypothetical protein BYT27DRAFT_6863273 [Phlegmacium glaucopus]
MTNHIDFPSTFQYSGNWISPGGSAPDGCVALSKEIFLDHWMMSKFNEINKLTDIYFEVQDDHLKLTKATTASPFQYHGYADLMGLKYHMWKYEKTHEASLADGNLKGTAGVKNYFMAMVAQADVCAIKLSGSTRLNWYLYVWPNTTEYEGL